MAKAMDEAITEIAAATNDATTTEEVRFRRIAIEPRYAAHPTSEVTIAMLSTLSPRALTPPSAKISDWSTTTTVTANSPIQGPSNTAASAPPSR